MMSWTMPRPLALGTFAATCEVKSGHCLFLQTQKDFVC